MRRAIFLTVMVASVMSLPMQASAQPQGDVIAVIVNGEPISTWEIGLLVPQVRGEMETRGLEPKGNDLIGPALQRTIDNMVLYQDAVSKGYEPNEERIAEKLKLLESGAGGRAVLEADLIQSGATYEQLRGTVVRADVAQSLVEAEILPTIEVSDEDVAAFYAENTGLFNSPDQIHSRHILLKVDSDAGPEERAAVRKRAVVAHARALSGENFAALARELSEGPTAANGGDLGFTERGFMVKDFDDAVWAVEPGEISEVVESQMGYHVIKVEEIVEGKSVSLEEARQLITVLIRQERIGAALAEYVAGLREKAVIEDPES